MIWVLPSNQEVKMNVVDLAEKAVALVGQSVHIYTTTSRQDIPSICKLTGIEGTSTLILKGHGFREFRLHVSEVAHLSRHEPWKFQAGRPI